MFLVRCFFLLSHFLVIEDYALSKSTSHLQSVPLTLECVRIVSWSIFFSTSTVYRIVLCVTLLLSEPMILLSTHHVTNHLTCRNNWDNLILKIKIVGKSFFFSVDWSIKILSLKAQTLKAAIQNSTKNSRFKDLKFLTKHPWNCSKNVPWNQHLLRLFIAISSSFAYKEMMHTLRNLKHCCFNLFHSINSNFSSVSSFISF